MTVYPQLDGVKIGREGSLPTALIQAIRKAYDYPAFVLPLLGTPGAQQPVVTTDMQGRVVSSAALATTDLPAGVNLTVHDQFYSVRSSSIGTVTIPSLTVGTYALNLYFGGVAAGAGNVVWTFSWTSGGTLRTVTSGAFAIATSTTTGFFATYPLHADAGTSVTYATTYTATGSYEFNAALTKL